MWLRRSRDPPAMTTHSGQDHEAWMDIRATIGGFDYAIDVSVINAVTEDKQRLKTRADENGKAAKTREDEKFTRYGKSVTPFVIEAHGRLGTHANTFLRTLAPPEGRSEWYQDVYYNIQRILATHVANAIQSATI